MKLARLSFIIAALGFAGFGLVLFIAPDLLETAGVGILDPAGRIELRAFYGGIEMGLAMFFVIALKKNWILPGLSVLIETNGFIVIARIAGLIMDDFQARPATWWSLAAEMSLLILGVIAIRLYRGQQKKD